MEAVLPLEKMTLLDKMTAMELLWDDLSRNMKAYPSPKWHGEILKKREDDVKCGKDEFEDWNDVKKELWNTLA